MKTYLVEMDLNNGIKIVDQFDYTTDVCDSSCILDWLKDEFGGVMGFHVTKAQLYEIVAKGYSIGMNPEKLDCCCVIFDNAGGITLQLEGWAHHYNGRELDCANDLIAWFKEKDTSSWEGHEIDALSCDPSDEEIMNGGYRVVQLDDTIQSFIKNIGGSGCAEDCLRNHLVKTQDNIKMETFATAYHHALFGGQWMDKSTNRVVLDGINKIDELMNVRIHDLISTKKTLSYKDPNFDVTGLNIEIQCIKEAIRFIKHSYNVCPVFTEEQQKQYDEQLDID